MAANHSALLHIAPHHVKILRCENDAMTEPAYAVATVHIACLTRLEASHSGMLVLSDDTHYLKYSSM